MKNINRNHGFAFVGILVAVAVAGIVGMFAASTYLSKSSDTRLLDNTVSRIINDIQALMQRKDQQQTQIEFVNGADGSYYTIKSGDKDAVKVDLPPGTKFSDGSTRIVLDPATGKPVAPATIGVVQNVELHKGIQVSSDGNVSATGLISQVGSLLCAEDEIRVTQTTFNPNTGQTESTSTCVGCSHAGKCKNNCNRKCSVGDCVPACDDNQSCCLD